MNKSFDECTRSITNPLLPSSICRVAQDTVVTDWLVCEQEKGTVDPELDIVELSPEERFDLLRNLWSPPRWGSNPDYRWYETQLSESELRSAMHVWGHFGVPGGIMDVARAIDAEDPGPEWSAVLEEQHDRVKKIESMYDRLPESLSGKLILRGHYGRPPIVVDGNHRAVALALYFINTGECPSVPTYVGFETSKRFPSITARFLPLIYALRWR